jgi:hypothetical protein
VVSKTITTNEAFVGDSLLQRVELTSGGYTQPALGKIFFFFFLKKRKLCLNFLLALYNKPKFHIIDSTLAPIKLSPSPNFSLKIKVN